jgi:hypothetical protein
MGDSLGNDTMNLFPYSRRAFLQSAAAIALGFRGLRTLLANDERTLIQSAEAPYGFGPLVPDPARYLDLPQGFTYHIVSRSGMPMDDGLLVPGRPDGMAAFAAPDGKTLLIRNHEVLAGDVAHSPYGPGNRLLNQVPPESLYDRGRGEKPCLGGVTTMLYDTKQRRLEAQFLSLAGTQFNCAGGPTPWNTWISCEEDTQRADATFEKDHGYPFEVPAVADRRLARPVPLTAMGRFRHEAVAVDPGTGIVYQTEDRPDGLIYRFLPSQRGRLVAGGRLQALGVRDQKSLDTSNWRDQLGNPVGATIAAGSRLTVQWLDVQDIQAPNDDLRHRGFQLGAARFARPEGMWYGRNGVYFACTEGGIAKKGQIWKYSPSRHEGEAAEEREPGHLELFIEPNNADILDNADNITVAPWGDLIVCEDGTGEQYLVGVTPGGQPYKLAKNAVNNSEFAGATFSPDGSTLFVNMQTAGLTFAITGPWRS